MKNQTYKTDKGVAGLTILLSLIVMLFVIGLLVMIFSIMGSKMSESVYDTTNLAVVNETISVPTTAGISLAGASYRDGACGTVVLVNGTAGTVISAGNYTQTGCVLTNKTASFSGFTTPKATYTITYSADNGATTVINDTTSSISSVSDWFDIFIVIGAMVVLILLTIIIIIAIKGSGMVGGAGNSANTVGTA